MSNLRQCRHVLIAALAMVFLCGTVAAEDSTRHIRTAEHEDKAGRDLAVAWTRPTYWKKYRKLLTLKRLKRCTKKQGVPPTSGSYCPSLKTGWHTCLFGEQTCKATPGVLPGLGDYVGATLGLKHPAIRCDCEAGSWTCYDWDVCLQQAAPAAAPAFCGGFAGIRCPSGFSCIDDPSDTCDPKQGGADCGGICVAEQICGSRGLAPCPDGQTCIDPDPTDNCDPRADCPGICAPTPTPTTTDVCPDKEPIGSDAVCSKDLKCTYGTESCCGKTFDSLVCQCSAGEVFGCFFTDACFTPSCPTTVPPVVVEDPPDANNDALCPATLPQSGDTCPAYLPDTAVCGYGTVSCCNGPAFTKTQCSCTGGIFECSTIAIKCASCDIPAPCDVVKTSWPELVGKPGTDAKAVIEKEEPCLTQVVIIPEGSAVTLDFRLDRVRIFVGSTGDVVVSPTVG
jgi:hypothetical protein